MSKYKSIILVITISFLWSIGCSGKLKDFYCGCEYSYYINNKGKKKIKVDISTCNFKSKTGEEPTIQMEHIVPVSFFGKGRLCWEEPICTDKRGKKYRGRNCCLKIDNEFKKIYKDKKNLKPVIGELNRARRDYPYGKAPNGDNYGGCYIKIDKSIKIVEADSQIAKEIDEIYLYMYQVYRINN